jgi:group I intron endonuclease
MKTCGIYCIRNSVNGKVYIGSSISIKSRWNTHRNQLRRGLHHSIYLQRAWVAYGEAAFTFEIVETVADCDQLSIIETRYMEAMGATDPNRGYNMAPVGGNTRGLKLGPHSEEHRQKIAAAHVGMKPTADTRAKLSASRKGRIITPETRAKLAALGTGRKMAPLSAEHRAAVSRTHKGKAISEAHRAALSRANKGHIKSPEETAKRKASLREYWARKRLTPSSPAKSAASAP